MSLNDIRARAAKGIRGEVSEPFAADTHTPKRPMSSPGAMAMLSPELDRLRDRNTVLEASAGKPLLLRLESLVSPVGRRRSLTADQFAELTENLRHNPLITPITVRALADGRYEVVAGNNRVEAYRDLGRTEIEAFVKDFESDTEDRAAFFANLLQPSLSAFEKYAGVKGELQRTGLSQRQIAKQAGIAESTVSEWLLFDQLPEPLIAVLRANAHVLSPNGAKKFALALKDGIDVARAVEVLTDMASTNMSEKDAVKRLQENGKSLKDDAQSVKRSVFRSGKASRCELVSRKLDLRLTFKEEADRQWIEGEVQSLLRGKYSELQK